MASAHDGASESSEEDSFEESMTYFCKSARLRRRGPAQADWEDCGIGQFGLPYVHRATLAGPIYERHFVFRDGAGNIIEKHSMETASGLVGTRDFSGLDEPAIQDCARRETCWSWTAIGSQDQPMAFELHVGVDAYEFWVQVGETQGSVDAVITNGYTTLSQHSVKTASEARDGRWAKLGKASFRLVQNNRPYIAMLEIREDSAPSLAATRHEQYQYLIRDAWVLSVSSSCDRTVRVAASCDVNRAVVSQMFLLEFDTKPHRVCFEIALQMGKSRNSIEAHSAKHVDLRNWECVHKSLQEYRNALNHRFQEAGVDETVDEHRTWPHKRQPDVSTEELARLQEPRYVR